MPLSLMLAGVDLSQINPCFDLSSQFDVWAKLHQSLLKSQIIVPIERNHLENYLENMIPEKKLFWGFNFIAHSAYNQGVLLVLES